jgi:WD40 repeat protein
MSQTESDSGERPLDWIDALHQAIASDSDANFHHPQLEGLSPEQFDKTRECLRLLESARRSQPSDPHPTRRVGRFEIVRELGRGGFGVVFLAVDARVGRRVALKVPRAEMLLGDGARRRFMREAKAAGALEHPNLIPLHEVGEDGPVCYIASAFCDGPNLASWVADRERPVGEFEAAALIEGLARGVEHAHRRGVLHRDIKPSNVLLEPFGGDATAEQHQQLSGYTPRLTDFGLAKLLEFPDEETRSGTLLGTPAYMAPEQAESRFDAIGPTTDVYALGVVLFELLAGVPPLRGQSDVQTLQLVARGEIPRLSRLRPGVSRDLEAITLKCLEREPSRRYASADQLGDDLKRFLNAEPTRARPARATERLFKWAKRRPAAAALWTVVLAATAVLAGGGWWYSNQLRVALAQVEARAAETRQFLYVASVNRAHRALASNQVQEAASQLETWIPRPGQPDLRDFAWHHLWKQLHEEERSLVGHTGDVHCVRYSPDGRLLVTASQDHTARIWDAASGQCLHELQGHTGDVNCVAFSSDGERLATASDDGTVRIWKVADGSSERVLSGSQGKAYGAAFSLDGAVLVTCGEEAKVHVWSTADWRELPSLDGHEGGTGLVEFSPSGKFLVTAGTDSAVCIWDMETRTLRHRLAHDSVVSSVSISRDEQRLLTGERENRMVKLWNFTTGEFVKPLSDHYAWIHGVAYDGSNAQYAVTTKEGNVELIDADSGKVLRRLRGHGVRVWSVAFSPDGRHMATGSSDRTVKIWNLGHSSYAMQDAPNYCIYSLAMSRDSKRFVIGDYWGDITLFDMETKLPIWNAGRDYELVGDFNGDGRCDGGYFVDGRWQVRLANDESAPGVTEKTYHLGSDRDRPVVGDWNGDGRDDLGVFQQSTGRWTLQTESEAGSTQSTIVFGGSRSSEQQVPIVGRWNDDGCDRIGIAEFSDNAWHFRFSRKDDELRLKVTGVSERATPIAGRWQTGKPNAFGFVEEEQIWIETLSAEAMVEESIQADGRRRLSCDEPKTARFSRAANWPMSTNALRAAHDLAHGQYIRARATQVAISGDLVALFHPVDRTAKVWNTRTSRRLGVVSGFGARLNSIAFSPDGTQLTVGDEKGWVTFVDVSSLKISARFRAHEQVLDQLAYSADGKILVTAGESGILKVWNSRGELQSTFRDQRPDTTQQVAISPDGKLIAAAGNNRLITIWSLQDDREIAVLSGHSNSILTIAFSPDGGSITSGSLDGTVRLWNLATHQEIYTLAAEVGTIQALAISSDGRELVAGGNTNPYQAVLHFWSASHADQSGDGSGQSE